MTDFDERDVRDEQERQRKALARAQEFSDFRWLMGDHRGRRFMWRALEKTRMFMSSMGPTDAATNFNEGQRNVGLFLLSEINAVCPALYAVMASENAPQQPDDHPSNDDQETDE